MKTKLMLFLMLSISGMSYSNALSPLLPDSAKYKWIKGEKYLLHKVLPKETWNSVSKEYELPVSELMNANLGVIDLKIGQILNVPVGKSMATVNKKTDPDPVTTDSKYRTAILYTVRSSETLFSISKRFGSSVEQVKKWNNLDTDIVQEGQKIIVSYVPSSASVDLKPDNKSDETVVINKKENQAEKISEIKKPSFEEAKPEETVTAKKVVILQETPKPESESQVSPPDTYEAKAEIPATNPNVDENPTRSIIPVGKGTSGKTLMQVNESGVCSWITDAEINQNKFYGLHRSAAIGTIVKVTNKMNDKYVFVKIVGVLPSTGENERSIIKISQAAVNKIGALDAHFQVELSYGVLQ